jgi:integrase
VAPRLAIKIQPTELRLDLALIMLGNCPYSCDSSDSAERQEAKYVANTHLALVPPAIDNRTVTPRRRPNRELRPREHLTEREVEMLIEAARANRWGQRDSTMILLGFRHGLRASELCELQWSDVEFESGSLHLRRAKGGASCTHPLLGDELRALPGLPRARVARVSVAASEVAFRRPLWRLLDPCRAYARHRARARTGRLRPASRPASLLRKPVPSARP